MTRSKGVNIGFIELWCALRLVFTCGGHMANGCTCLESPVLPSALALQYNEDTRVSRVRK